VAAAEAIKAGDEGGRKLWVLGGGLAVGAAGNALFGIPMSAFGVAFIGNIRALTMFGVGLLIRSYSAVLFDNAKRASFRAATSPRSTCRRASCWAPAWWHWSRSSC
jgi:hypothetical protein